mgnify:FL=1
MIKELHKVGDIVDITQLHWYSDYNGDEVFFPEYLIVGLYRVPSTQQLLLVETEDGLVLEIMENMEE